MGGSTSQTMATPVVNATAKQTATVIFLHGLGDTGHGWAQAFENMKQPHIKFVCPSAPAAPVTLNGGFRMPSWFDIYGLSPDAKEDEQGIRTAAAQLQTFIAEEEKNGISRSRIMVGGFSQGGAVALFSALSIAKPPLAGIIALSTWLPLHQQFAQLVQANQDTPILQCHGKDDPLVNFSYGQLTGQALSMINKKHMFKSYSGLQHSSCPQELEDVSKFILEHLPPV